jgi:anhydro-N-acetylmuramic acid kinase
VVDAAAVKFSIRPIACGFRPYTERLAAQLRSLRTGDPVDIGTISDMHSLLGWVYADAIAGVAREQQIDMLTVAAIGLHGQTVWHAPAIEPMRARRHGTMQLGQPAVVAELVHRPVVSDFRASDMAAGGQGAPLVPFADYVMFASATETRAVLNLGGIANLTYLPAGGGLDDVVGFDTGPGNLIIDGLTRRFTGKAFDESGAMALMGTPVDDVVDGFLEQEYFDRDPPKSTGAEQFGDEAVEYLADALKGYSVADAIATATRITAASIARAAQQHLPGQPRRIIVGGGGLKNSTLMRDICTLLPSVDVVPHEAHGIDSDAKEAIAFALLACARMHRIPANLPSVTGARGRRLLGVVTEQV